MNGIPSFKLEKSVVERRVDMLRSSEWSFDSGSRLAKMCRCRHLTEEFMRCSWASAHKKPKALDVPGANLNGVVQALPFLIQKNVAMPWSQRNRGGGKTSHCSRWRRHSNGLLENGRSLLALPKRRASIGVTSPTCRAAGKSILTPWKKERGSLFLTNPIALKEMHRGALQASVASGWN